MSSHKYDMRYSDIITEAPKQPKVSASKYMYHATVSPKIEGIFKMGLRPDISEKNWSFSDSPENVTFFADTPEDAMYFGNIVSRNHYELLGWKTKPYVVLLRTPTNAIKNLTKGREEYFTTSAIPPQNLEAFLHDKWKPLLAAKIEVENIAAGYWDDEDTEIEDDDDDEI